MELLGYLFDNIYYNTGKQINKHCLHVKNGIAIARFLGRCIFQEQSSEVQLFFAENNLRTVISENVRCGGRLVDVVFQVCSRLTRAPHRNRAQPIVFLFFFLPFFVIYIFGLFNGGPMVYDLFEMAL